MSDQKGFTGTVFLIGVAVLGIVVVDQKFNGDPKPQPEPTPAPTAPGTSTPSPPDSLLLARAQREVRGLLKDPESAVFDDITVRRSPTLVVCGTVNSRNSFGGMTGRQRFVSGAVTAVEEQMPAGEMAELWSKLGC